MGIGARALEKPNQHGAKSIVIRYGAFCAIP